MTPLTAARMSCCTVTAGAVVVAMNDADALAAKMFPLPSDRAAAIFLISAAHPPYTGDTENKTEVPAEKGVEKEAVITLSSGLLMIVAAPDAPLAG